MLRRPLQPYLPFLPYLVLLTMLQASQTAFAAQNAVLNSDTSFASGFTHPLLGLDHLLAMAAVGLWSGQIGGRWIWLGPLGFMAMMAIGGAIGINGGEFPNVEAGIIFSVMLFGLLVAGAIQPLPWVGVLLVASFGIFHGFAHGAEMLQDANGLLYACGFILSTGLLHLFGITLSRLLQKTRSQLALQVMGAGISLAGIYLMFA
jgi:urease accessory protein